MLAGHRALPARLGIAEGVPWAIASSNNKRLRKVSDGHPRRGKSMALKGNSRGLRAKDTPNNNCYDFGDCLGLIV
jgi:hypothetical protein